VITTPAASTSMVRPAPSSVATTPAPSTSVTRPAVPVGPAQSPVITETPPAVSPSSPAVIPPVLKHAMFAVDASGKQTDESEPVATEPAAPAVPKRRIAPRPAYGKHAKGTAPAADVKVEGKPKSTPRPPRSRPAPSVIEVESETEDDAGPATSSKPIRSTPMPNKKKTAAPDPKAVTPPHSPMHLRCLRCVECHLICSHRKGVRGNRLACEECHNVRSACSISTAPQSDAARANAQSKAKTPANSPQTKPTPPSKAVPSTSSLPIGPPVRASRKRKADDAGKSIIPSQSILDTD